ncbi:butyrophilin subfamily 1 member A1-like [Perca flavescens]|uniref:butyrophilin subfamily 1 member A1-like n=1 Tax=Perca flavescens TaxID=8167 RepID=UPI00106E16D1|nr:butyrophilin subfamily 1 member A1-like [Perca flavescens]
MHVAGPSQPTLAKVGDEVILPCQLEPATKASGMTVEWARPDLNPRFVYVWRDGVELESKTHPSYKRTTKVFPEQKLGDVSLNLSKVKLSDGGTYKCFIPGHGDSLIQLLVGAVNSLFIVSINISSSGVILQCESEGWYPEPEVLWLDGEGNLLSAGPPETVRGPDDLYTVSSRVTVEKRHSNSFTCRVQQKNINQTRETHIQIAETNPVTQVCDGTVKRQ